VREAEWAGRAVQSLMLGITSHSALNIQMSHRHTLDGGTADSRRPQQHSRAKGDGGGDSVAQLTGRREANKRQARGK
jgi:hypothetical protein